MNERIKYYHYNFENLSKEHTIFILYCYYHKNDIATIMDKKKHKLLIHSRSFPTMQAYDKAIEFAIEKTFFVNLVKTCHKCLQNQPKYVKILLRKRFTHENNTSNFSQNNRQVFRYLEKAFSSMSYFLQTENITNEYMNNDFLHEYRKHAKELFPQSNRSHPKTIRVKEEFVRKQDN